MGDLNILITFVCQCYVYVLIGIKISAWNIKTQNTFRLLKLLMAEYLRFFIIYIYILRINTIQFKHQKICYGINNFDEMPFIHITRSQRL